MKKIIITVAVLLLVLAAFVAGQAAGVRHAICDSCIWTVDRYDPEDPESSAWGEYDQLIFIELDGQVFEHGMYQG